MRKLRGFIPTTMFIAVMAFGTTFAHAGLLISDFSGGSTSRQSCTETKVKVDSGIIVGGFTGIIVGGFTGIIVGGFTNDTTVDCGIIVGG